MLVLGAFHVYYWIRINTGGLPRVHAFLERFDRDGDKLNKIVTADKITVVVHIKFRLVLQFSPGIAVV